MKKNDKKTNGIKVEQNKMMEKMPWSGLEYTGRQVGERWARR